MLARGLSIYRKWPTYNGPSSGEKICQAFTIAQCEGLPEKQTPAEEEEEVPSAFY